MTATNYALTGMSTHLDRICPVAWRGQLPVHRYATVAVSTLRAVAGRQT